MALPYPEGEVFFRHAALRSNTFNPGDDSHFYGHFLIEWVYNAWDEQNGPARSHPRAHYRRETPR